MFTALKAFFDNVIFGGVAAELDREMKKENGEERYTVFYATNLGRLGVLQLGDRFYIKIEARSGKERSIAKRLAADARWKRRDENGQGIFVREAFSYQLAGWALRGAIQALHPVIVVSPYLRIPFGVVAEYFEGERAIYEPLLTYSRDSDAVTAFVAAAHGYVPDEDGEDYFLEEIPRCNAGADELP